MATRTQLEGQIAFALDRLTVRNAHHEFEHLCRHLAQARIASNVVPVTGPVSAGGDAARDIETYTSYLRQELGDSSAFLALVEDGTAVFTCTLQQEALKRKVENDVKTVMGGALPPDRIYALTSKPMPMGVQQQVINAVAAEHEVVLEILDGERISAMLADPETFWIAEEFLDLPSELVPPETGGDVVLPEWYTELRTRWRSDRSPAPTAGDFSALKRGLRRAMHHRDARADLPLWLGHMRQLSQSDVSLDLRQRARYEVSVAALRGAGSMKPADGLVEAFFGEVGDASATTARLLDGATLLSYAFGAKLRGATNLTVDQLASFNADWAARVTTGVAEQPSLNDRAVLLRALAMLRIQPKLVGVELHEEFAPAVDPADADVEFAGDMLLWGGVPMIDADGAVAAWLALARLLEKAPLFPVESLSKELAIVTTSFADHRDWPELTALVDEALSRAAGSAAAAGVCRDRAMRLRRCGRIRPALHELHRAKIDWWSGDMFRGALLAMMLIADCYMQLNLAYAAKHYALAVCAGAQRHDEDSLDLVPSALFAAGDADYLAGAWCGASEWYAAAIFSARAYWEGEPDDHPDVLRAIAHLGWIRSAASVLAPNLSDRLEASFARTGATGYVDSVRDEIPMWTAAKWQDVANEELTGPLFADAGTGRTISFAALGTRWTVRSSTRLSDARAAERLAAAAQIVLVETAEIDLCLLPTAIDVSVSAGDPTGVTPPTPSNPAWDIRLSAYEADIDLDAFNTELLSAVLAVVHGASLADENLVDSALDIAFARGLTHKLGTGRPYDELAAMIDDERYKATGRETVRGVHQRKAALSESLELPWNDRPGPTYALSRSQEIIARRYRTLAGLQIHSLPRLRRDPAFLRLVDRLRDAGWRDWHVVTAVHNVTMNELQGMTTADLSPSTRRRFERMASEPEPAQAAEIPLDRYTEQALNAQRQGAMLASLPGWGLHLNQARVDPTAIECFLAARYHYWDDDVDHDDPFASAT
jgi:hypothetical protein